jgi:hypothetical protein
MMFGLLHRSVIRHFGVASPAFLAAIGGRNRRHVARHILNPDLAEICGWQPASIGKVADDASVGPSMRVSYEQF